MSGGGATRARAEIDAGAGRDKVPMFDPSAAPMETGAEAAGTPMPQTGEQPRVAPPPTEAATRPHPRAAFSAPMTRDFAQALAGLAALVLLGAIFAIIGLT